MIVNDKIGKIKLELLKEEFIKQIKDSYTLNLSMVLLEEFENLQQENKQLKEQVQDLKADYGTIAQIERDLYKEVIEEVRKYTKKEIREYKYAIDETTMDSNTEDIYDMVIRNFEKLLQILDKAKD